jgi:hypothetical protein
MTHRHSLAPFLLAFSLAVACSAPAVQEGHVSVDLYQDHVEWLADDDRKGRDTATPALYEAAEWAADRFAEVGVLPLGDDDGWLQEFTVLGRRRLIDGNELVLGGQALDLRREWIPLQTAMEGSVSGPVVFAGYGISDSEGGYDDYAELDVKDKVVLVLRKGPRSSEEGTRYGPEGEGVEHTTFIRKVNTAFRMGAAALLVVNDPANHPPGRRRDRLMPYRPLAGDAAAASLPAAHLTGRATSALLAGHGLVLADVQKQIDESMAPVTRALDGLEASLVIAAERPELPTVNVVGHLPGNDPDLAGEYVLVGAHMDHLGEGMNTGSRGGADARGDIHNGADDNASGTAGVLGLARVLAGQREELRRTVVFVLYSGEEWGLLGSRHFAEEPPLPLEGLVAAINMDMIGRSVDGYVAIEGVGTSAGFSDLVVRAHDELGLALDLHLAEGATGNSDHAAFMEKDVPVINFFTGLHDDYHRPSDDSDKINVETGAAIASMAGRLALLISSSDERPLFVDVGGAETGHPAVATAEAGEEGDEPPATSGYRVVFGTSPDMGYQKGDGVRISSVREGTPAEKCGLLGGDRIVALDGKPVRSLEDYAVLLFAHKVGDEISVTIVRGEETLELEAVLEGQAGDS